MLCALTAHGGGGHLADLSDVAGGVALGDAGMPTLDFRARAVIHVGVRLELEEKVAAVDNQKKNTGSCCDGLENNGHVVGKLGDILPRDRGAVPSFPFSTKEYLLACVSYKSEAGLTVRPAVVCSGNNQTADGQCEQTRGSLGYSHVEVLLLAVDTTKEETHAQHQQQVRQHTADE